jgi:hypothetical protein
VAEGHYAGLVHCGVAFEQAFDFDRKNVFAAANEHVIGATDKKVEALGIATADVTGVIPAALQSFRRFLGKVVVTQQDARVFQQQFAFVGIRAVDQSGFGSGVGHTDRTHRARFVVGVWSQWNRSAFGNAVDNQGFGVGEMYADIGQQLR